MPAHGPIHLPLDEEDSTDVTRPKVTASGVVYEVVRTVSTASAFGLQVYSTIYAKKSAGSYHDGELPHRFDVILWSALGTWQAQATYAACLVSFGCLLAYMDKTLNPCLFHKGRCASSKRLPHPESPTYQESASGVFNNHRSPACNLLMHRLPGHLPCCNLLALRNAGTPLDNFSRVCEHFDCCRLCSWISTSARHSGIEGGSFDRSGRGRARVSTQRSHSSPSAYRFHLLTSLLFLHGSHHHPCISSSLYVQRQGSPAASSLRSVRPS